MSHPDTRLKRTFERSVAATALTVSATLGMTACAKHIEYPVDESVNCVDIFDGASLRSEPSKPDFRYEEADNVITVVDFGGRYKTSPIKISAVGLSKTYKHSDKNGQWYGIPANELAHYFNDKQDKAAIEKDADRIVWINEQRAQPCKRELG